MRTFSTRKKKKSKTENKMDYLKRKAISNGSYVPGYDLPSFESIQEQNRKFTEKMEELEKMKVRTNNDNSIN